MASRSSAFQFKGEKIDLKEVAQKLGARYGADGWYAPPGVDLSAFKENGWL